MSPSKLCLHLAMNPFLLLPLLLLLRLLQPALSAAPLPPPPPPPPPPYASAYNSCTSGVSVLYSLQSITPSFPRQKDPALQPYAFTANLQIFNAGEEDVKGWEVFIGYVNNEILVSAGGALIADGSQLPANASGGITLTSPSAVLKTAIETALDYNQMGVNLVLTGTEFGQSQNSMPNNISLTTPGYSCSTPVKSNNTIETCCSKENATIKLSTNNFLPIYKGDITIFYDVIQAITANYWAQVTITNDSPTARLDFWNLQWTWQKGEFIYAMKGAETTEQDQGVCFSGPAGVAYASTDFSQVMSCQATPTIIDLDQYKANQSDNGPVNKYCCRNGTLLPSIQDPIKSKSEFQLQVFKLPPQNQNATLIDPPVDWKISGVFDSDYTCDQPRLVQPTQFPDSASAQRTEAAVMSWQVTCNVTKPTTKKCCVSFSSYTNESVVPCKTCACGCTQPQPTCNASAEALLIPVELATVPFVNRTAKTLAWAQLNHLPEPNVLPCADNCGVSVNWHFLSDFTNGWSARITIFNWQGLQFSDWSAAVELGATFPGFQQAYSFNYSTPGNNTIFLFGQPGLNYLNGIYDNYPGIQQSVLSFTKDGVSANLSTRDYFPTKVFFDGNECTLPDIFPSGNAGQLLPRIWGALFIPLLLLGIGPFGFL